MKTLIKIQFQKSVGLIWQLAEVILVFYRMTNRWQCVFATYLEKGSSGSAKMATPLSWETVASFLERIVTGGETWIHYHQPETKKWLQSVAVLSSGIRERHYSLYLLVSGWCICNNKNVLRNPKLRPGNPQKFLTGIDVAVQVSNGAADILILWTTTMYNILLLLTTKLIEQLFRIVLHFNGFFLLGLVNIRKSRILKSYY